MTSKAKTVEEYISELDSDRLEEIEKVRELILESLPVGYEETMQYGMISYVVPLSIFPEGYLGDKNTPLPYISLASQKNYISIYLHYIYGEKEEWFREEYEKTGKKLNMGKSCLRIKKFEDLASSLLKEVVSQVPPEIMVQKYLTARSRK